MDCNSYPLTRDILQLAMPYLIPFFSQKRYECHKQYRFCVPVKADDTFFPINPQLWLRLVKSSCFVHFCWRWEFESVRPVTWSLAYDVCSLCCHDKLKFAFASSVCVLPYMIPFENSQIFLKYCQSIKFREHECCANFNSATLYRAFLCSFVLTWTCVLSHYTPGKRRAIWLSALFSAQCLSF